MFKTISISELINQPDMQVDFLVDRFEEMVEPENIAFAYKHNFYEILWITKGKSQQNIDYKNYSISENTLFFISPGQLHMFEEGEILKVSSFYLQKSFSADIFQMPCLH